MSVAYYMIYDRKAVDYLLVFYPGTRKSIRGIEMVEGIYRVTRKWVTL